MKQFLLTLVILVLLAAAVLAACLPLATCPYQHSPGNTRSQSNNTPPANAETKAESETQTATETQTARSPSIDEMLLFFPLKHPAGQWKPAKLQFTDVWFAAQDQTKLHAWYCPCDRPRATILIAHGNAGNVATRAGWLEYLQTKLRVSTLLFDYRGYGRSEGTPTVKGALQDARAARAELRRLAGIGDQEMLLMGESLGGAVVVQLASESAPRGLILQSTFSSLKDVAAIHYPNLAWLVPSDKLNSIAAINRYRGPLFQSHGTADRTIPFASGLQLFESAHEPKTLVRIPGADHNNWMNDQYLNQLDEFIERNGEETGEQVKSIERIFPSQHR